jgi:ATP/maltotriose-dependent transcriptional regulator MalT
VAIAALAVPIERSAGLLDRVAEPDADDHTRDPRSSYLLGMAAHAVYDCERAGRLFDDASAQLRAGGRLGLLAQVLTMRAWDAIPLGELAIAQAAADDGGQLARETGQPVWTAGAQVANALLAAMRGETAASEGLLEEAEKTTIPMGLSSIMCVGLAAHGVAALAAGRPDDALQHLLRMFEPADPAYHMMDRIQGITYLADAALAAGRRDQVDAIMSGLEVTAARAPSPVLHLGLIYARALLADDDAAEPLFETALGSGLRERAFHRARLQLAYGAWLRRKRRTAESRAPLRAARDTFDALGTTPWGERARQELRASGERSRQRVPGARERLTTQELQIAELASTGLSNRDIGQQLFLSPRTVASHLYRLFPKLGITSRAQLHAALSSDAPQSSIQSFR